MITSSIIWASLLPAAQARAQQGATVSGIIVERTQPVPIRSATVRLADRPPQSTDDNGRFAFDRVAPGRHTLIVEALGYERAVLDLVVRADTTVRVVLDPDPIALETLVARVGSITIEGSLRTAEGRGSLPEGMVTLFPGSRRVRASNGRFRFEDVPRGQPVTLHITAFEYLPMSVELDAVEDTTVEIAMRADSVAIRLIARQADRLAQRAQSMQYSVRALGRKDIENAGGIPIGELVRRQVPIGVIPPRPPYPNLCIFVDDRPAQFEQLLGTPSALIERVEIFGSRARSIRVYTKRYVARLMGSPTLESIKYQDVGMSLLCG